MTQYAARLRRLICEGVQAKDYNRPLAGFRIVVDAGNGAGGFYARDVLEPLGADVSGSQFLEPDGRFPNHIPNPENPEAMASVCAATLKAGADLGVIFDTEMCIRDRGDGVGLDGDPPLPFQIHAVQQLILHVPVSYTHLSRPSYRSEPSGTATRRSRPQASSCRRLRYTVARLSAGLSGSVSYTHLDVYKRQVKRRPKYIVARRTDEGVEEKPR